MNSQTARGQLAVFLRRHRKFFHRRWLRKFYKDAVPHMGALFDLGVGAHDGKDWGRACELYAAALGVLPHPWAYNNRGLARKQQGDLAGAIQDYDRAIELDPQDPTAYNNRGNVRAEQKDLAGAIQDYDRAIELDPQDPTAYNNRGGLYLELRAWERARSDYERRVALSPEDALNAYVDLGIIAWRGEKTGEAKSWFERALSAWDVSLERQRQSPAALWENRAIALLCLGSAQEALEALEQSTDAMEVHEVIESFRYDLLAEVSHPPAGLPEVRKRLEVAAQRRCGPEAEE